MTEATTSMTSHDTVVIIENQSDMVLLAWILDHEGPQIEVAIMVE